MGRPESAAMSLRPQHAEDYFVTNPATGVSWIFFLIEAARSSMGLTTRFDGLQFYVAHVPDGTVMDLHRIVG